jgi:exopolysaccharide production protein ExoQ
MIVIIRARVRPTFDSVFLTTIVLLQAALLVWLGDRLSATLAAIIVMSGVAVCATVPGAASQASALIRSLARNLRWWHWLWAFLFCSDFVFRMRDAQSIQDDPLDSWALYRVALVGLAGLVLLLRLATQRGHWVRLLFSGLLPVMAAFPLIGLVSTAWSIYPAWTAYKSLEFLVDISVLAAALAAAGTVENLKSLFDWTWVLFAALQCSVWVGAVVAPSLALLKTAGSVAAQLTGVFPNLSANGVGHIAAILAVVALSRLLRKGTKRRSVLLYWLLFLSSVATLILAQTRSALIGFIAGAVLVLFLSRRVAVVFTIALAAIILLLATSVESTFWTYFRRGQDAQLLESLSGRTTWWSFAWARFLERPLTGYGAFAGGRFAALAEMGDQSTSSVHNTYLEAILGIGILGIVPLLICLLGTWWRVLKVFLSRATNDLTRNIGLEAAGVLMVITVRSFFTTDLIWHPALPWLLVLGFGELLRRQERMIAS